MEVCKFQPWKFVSFSLNCHKLYPPNGLPH